MLPYAAFMIGLLGSLHCLGMCGPIAFALPVRTSNPYIKVLKYLLYNLGRIFTYGILGLAIGLAGRGLELAGVQRIVSVTTGALLILSVFVVHNPLKVQIVSRVDAFISRKLQSAYAVWFRKTGGLALFVLGMLNGGLPCGMVYTAMLGALGTGDVLFGGVFMLLFGLGTLPMMLMASILGSTLGSLRSRIFRKAIPIAACLVGVLLIFRGLHMEIPYVKPITVCGRTAH